MVRVAPRWRWSTAKAQLRIHITLLCRWAAGVHGCVSDRIAHGCPVKDPQPTTPPHIVYKKDVCLMARGCFITVRRKDTQVVHLQGYGGRPYHTANRGTDVFDTEVLLCTVRLAINACRCSGSG